MILKNALRLAFAIGLFDLLAGCGGSGSPEPTPTTTPVPTDGVVMGVVEFMPMAATITAYEAENTTVIASTSLDSLGGYTLDITSTSTNLFIEAVREEYVEPYTGIFVSPVDDVLSAVTPYVEGQTLTVSLTALTHLARCYADYGEDVATVDQANTLIASFVDFDILNTEPLDITSVDSATNNGLTDGHKYGLWLTALSALSKYISDENNSTQDASSQYTSSYLAARMCDDITFDGVLNGVSDIGQITIGTVVLNPGVYRNFMTYLMTEILNSDVNQSSLTIDDVSDFIAHIESQESLFGNGVDIDAPILVSSDIPATISGELMFDVTAIDFSAIASIEIELGDTLLMSSNENQTTVILNSVNYENGDHLLRITAHDIFGNSIQQSNVVVIDNFTADITINSDLLTSSENYTLSGSYSASSDTISAIEVNGNSAVIEGNTWTIDLVLTDTLTPITVEIFDEGNNAQSITETIEWDRWTPNVSIIETDALFSFGVTSRNLCEFGTLSNGSMANFPLCLNEVGLSLGGVAISPVLIGDDIFSIGIVFDDFENFPVTTDVLELDVEYMYEREGEGVIVDWQPMWRADYLPNNSYLPLTTEFLGDDFWVSGEDTEHHLTFRVTDNAGLSSTTTITVRFQFFE